jgi:endo-1,4-beta-xylanase
VIREIKVLVAIIFLRVAMARIAHSAVALLIFGTCALAFRKRHAKRGQTLSPESSALGSSLRNACEKRGLLCGIAISYNYGWTQGDSNYLDIAAKQFNVVTAENACKMSVLKPQKGKYDWSQCDAIYNFTKNTMKGKLRGHALCWGKLNGLPGWMKTSTISNSEVESELKTFIRDALEHYGTEGILGWDVVNEAITDEYWDTDFIHKPHQNPLSKLGSGYIDMCFREAHAVNPNIKLFYNDYNVGASEGSWTSRKADRMYEMVKSMLERGVPIHGVGLQLHVSYDMNSGENSYASKSFLAGVRKNVERLGALGVEVHFTEIDVGMIGSGSWTREMEEKQADIYQSLLETCLAVPQCKVFQLWGYSDKYTWRGTDQHPLIFSENFVPKQAYWRMLEVLEGRIKTPEPTPVPTPGVEPTPVPTPGPEPAPAPRPGTSGARRYYSQRSTCQSSMPLSGKIAMTSLADCKRACDATIGCIAFDTDSRTQCFLKSRCEGVQGQCNDWCSYATEGAFAYNRLSSKCANAAAVSDKLSVASYAECALKCDALHACNGFDSDGIECYLKDTCEGEVIGDMESIWTGWAGFRRIVSW